MVTTWCYYVSVYAVRNGSFTGKEDLTMTTSLQNIDLLLKTGKKHVCLVNYSWRERRTSPLLPLLAQNGFRVGFADDAGELMKLFVQMENSGEKSRLRLAMRQLKAALFTLSGKLHPHDGLYNRDTLVLVSTGDTALCEAAQLTMQEIGGLDRLFFYDAKRNRILQYAKPVLNYLEYHVAWHCNLNCKGCSHYCNLYDQPRFGDPEKFRVRLLRLRELFGNITTIRLMGGEPFLNPDLGVFAQIAREVFPDTDLRVVSNGLLIPKVDARVLQCLRDNQAIVDISAYPPTVKMLDKITSCLDSAGVPWETTEEIKEFRLIVGQNKRNGTDNFNQCYLRGCHFLHDDGRLTVCGIPCFYNAARAYLRSENEVSEQDWLHIDSVKDGYEILRLFNRPIPFCTYCLTREQVLFPWQQQYREKVTEEQAEG